MLPASSTLEDRLWQDAPVFLARPGCISGGQQRPTQSLTTPQLVHSSKCNRTAESAVYCVTALPGPVLSVGQGHNPSGVASLRRDAVAFHHSLTDVHGAVLFAVVQSDGPDRPSIPHQSFLPDQAASGAGDNDRDESDHSPVHSYFQMQQH